ncbi:cytochrome [Halioglobus japonicus]|uniref:Cytochrome P450 n=1 Tax=Halioglobus japonicus TaxID=930805 RepID=A0AAP8MD02_9GAMM|nr:cytochrome P450 [Halioglobus japonicus]AQA17584.1 cytochrome [Halioglobus japonicus]PLW85520.1 cytochrome P450 [Halioglobus japonicus]GHD16089.1 cytochrome P450 [Halioglobus japonicus]
MNIDIYSPDAYTTGIPHEQFKWLRDNDPIHWHAHPEGGGYWVVSRHADVITVSRDFKTFSAEQGFVLVDDLPGDILDMARNQLLGMDPPKHSPLRRAVITRFTSRRLEQLEPAIREIARGMMETARNIGEVNFVESLAGDLPTAVIGSLLDIPRDMWPQMRRWSDLQTSASDPDLGGTPEEVNNASIEMGTYGFQLACERKDSGADDLISLLINQEVEGESVSEAEFASLFVQIAVAGNETTRGLISSGMYELIQRPELYRQLEQNPDLIPGAVEEMLRWTCPLHYFRRTATADAEIAGQAIAQGDKVVMLYSAANFDERVFDNPMEFNIHRDSNPHLAFGHGIHLCLGANLARLEARIFLEEFFREFGGIELTGEPAFIRSNMVHGFKQMPVRLLPR